MNAIIINYNILYIVIKGCDQFSTQQFIPSLKAGVFLHSSDKDENVIGYIKTTESACDNGTLIKD